MSGSFCVKCNKQEIELKNMKQQILHYEELTINLKNTIKELTNYKNECFLKQEENDILKQQLRILENQYQIEKDSIKVKNIFQREMDNYTKMQVELNSLRMENERLRPQCGKILILQEKVENLTEKNTKLEDKIESLTKELQHFQNGNVSTNSFSLINSETTTRNSTMINETINHLTNNIQVKNNQITQYLAEINELKIHNEKFKNNADLYLMTIAKYKTKSKQYKEKYEQLSGDFENFKRENVSYKELLDKIMKMQTDSKNIYTAIQEAYNEKLRALKMENTNLKSLVKGTTTNSHQNITTEINNNTTSSHSSNLVLSLSNSPYELHVKKTLNKLNEAYKHNRILVNTLKMSKKLNYWKENKLLPTDFIDEIKKLPTSQAYHDIQEKSIQMEKLLNQIKIVCNNKILQVKKDMMQILGYDVEFDCKNDSQLKLLSIFAPTKSDYIVFQRDSNGGSSYQLCNESQGITYTVLINNILSKINNNPSIESSPWPIYISHLTLELYNNQKAFLSV